MQGVAQIKERPLKMSIATLETLMSLQNLMQVSLLGALMPILPWRRKKKTHSEDELNESDIYVIGSKSENDSEWAVVMDTNGSNVT